VTLASKRRRHHRRRHSSKNQKVGKAEDPTSCSKEGACDIAAARPAGNSLSQSRTGHVHPQLISEHGTFVRRPCLRTWSFVIGSTPQVHDAIAKHMVDGLGASGDLLCAHRHCSAGFNLVSKRRRSRLLHPVHLCLHVEGTTNREKHDWSMEELAREAYELSSRICRAPSR
jgi:hypothetical protein